MIIIIIKYLIGDSVTLGQKLKILREGKDLTQIGLARELNNITPFSQARVSSYERDNTIPIWSRLSRILMEWRLQSGSPEWVFQGHGDKPLSGEGWHNKHWQAIKTACNLPARLRFHDLRHTFASIMLAGGAAPGDVQRLLRHSSYGTTMDIYRHIMPGQLERNFEIFNLGSGEQSGERKTQV